MAEPESHPEPGQDPAQETGRVTIEESGQEHGTEQDAALEAARKTVQEFNFDDDAPKKKKSKNKGKAKKPVPLTKEYYEKKLLELNRRLADVRRQFDKKNNVNQKLVKELVTIEEDRVEVSAHLERVIAFKKEAIKERDRVVKQLEKDCNAYKKWSQERILELQRQYERDYNQFQGEVKLQTGALNSLGNYREERDAALAQFERHQNETDDIEKQTEEDLFQMEQKAVIHKNKIKKEVEERLEQLVEEFLHSNEIRNAGYTRSLIQENTALKRRLDKLVKLNVRAMADREKQLLYTREIIESYTALEELTKQLERTIANKDHILERLQERIDRMRARYVDARRYRRLYNYAKSRGEFDRDPKTFQDVADDLERLNLERDAIIARHHAQHDEIEQMRCHLNKLHRAIERTIYSLDSADANNAFHAPDRRQTISELIYLILSESPEEDATIYHPGACGLVRPLMKKDDLFDTILEPSDFRSPSEIEEFLREQKRKFCEHRLSTEETPQDFFKSEAEPMSGRPKNCPPMKSSAPDILERTDDQTKNTSPDALRMQHQFEKCFEDLPNSTMVVKGETDFMVLDPDLLKKMFP